MNRGRRRRTLPSFKDAAIEFIEVKQDKRDDTRWIATFKINGWPHDIAFWAKDELDVMKQAYEWQRGNTPANAFDVSR